MGQDTAISRAVHKLLHTAGKDAGKELLCVSHWHDQRRQAYTSPGCFSSPAAGDLRIAPHRVWRIVKSKHNALIPPEVQPNAFTSTPRRTTALASVVGHRHHLAAEVEAVRARVDSMKDEHEKVPTKK